MAPAIYDSLVHSQRSKHPANRQTYPSVVPRKVLAGEEDIPLALAGDVVEARELPRQEHGVAAARAGRPQHVKGLDELLVHVDLGVVGKVPAQVVQADLDALLPGDAGPPAGVAHPAVQQQHARAAAAQVVGREHDPAEPQVRRALAPEARVGARPLPEPRAEVQADLVQRLVVRAPDRLLLEERPLGPVDDAVDGGRGGRDDDGIKGRRVRAPEPLGGELDAAVGQVGHAVDPRVKVDVLGAD